MYHEFLDWTWLFDSPSDTLKYLEHLILCWSLLLYTILFSRLHNTYLHLAESRILTAMHHLLLYNNQHKKYNIPSLSWQLLPSFFWHSCIILTTILRHFITILTYPLWSLKTLYHYLVTNYKQCKWNRECFRKWSEH